MADSAFARASAVTPLGEGRYRCELEPDWAIGDKPHGGYTMATLTRAALVAAERPHPLVVSAHFLRPPEFAAAELQTDVRRRGRRVTTVHARLVQAGRTCLEAIVAAGEVGDAGHDWTAGPQPPIADRADCYGSATPHATEVVGLRRQLDLRLDPQTVGFTRGEPAGRAELRGWVRLADGAAFDPLSMIVAADALPPVVLELGHAGWAPTVELTFLLRALPAPGWLAAYAHANAVSADGWFDENADLYDARGHLVAQSRQLALSGRAMVERQG